MRLLPDAGERQGQKSQHRANDTHDRVGLREQAGFNEDLAGDEEADRGQQQAAATDGDRQISYRFHGQSWSCGECGIAHAGHNGAVNRMFLRLRVGEASAIRAAIHQRAPDAFDFDDLLKFEDVVRAWLWGCQL
jgi:hypothetical protein